MRLLSLEVKGAACFRNPIRLGEFDPQINIIYGPNECGKSTLITCLARAFFDKSNTRAQEVESLRPWRTALSPEVSVEFLVGSGTECMRYRLNKGFLDRAYTHLSEWTGAGYELLADGDKAEEIVRGMWRSSAPARGATKIDHWGLARLLWFRQESERFERPPLNDETLLNELRQTLQVMTITKEEEALFGLLEAELTKMVTGKRRDFVRNSPIDQLRKQRDELTATIAEVAERLESVEELSERVAYLQAAISKSVSDRDAKKAEQNQLLGEVERVKELRNRIEVAQGQLRELRARHETLRADKEAVKNARESIDKLDKELQPMKADCERVESEMRDLGKRIDEKEEEQKDLRERLREAKSKLDRCRRVKQLRSWAQQIEQIRSLLDKLKGKTEELDKVKADLKSLSVPSREEVERAEELRSQVAALEARLKAVGLSFEVVAHADVALEFDPEETNAKPEEGEPRAARSDLRAGESKTFHASQAATLRVPDLLTVRVKSGSGEVASVREELGEAQTEAAALLSRYSAGSTAELHQIVAEADRLRNLQGRLQKEIAELTPIDRADLEEDLEGLEDRLKSGLASENLSMHDLASVDPGDEDQLGAEVDKLETDDRHVQEELDELRKTVAEDREHCARLTAQIEGNQDLRKLHQARIENALKDYGGDESVLDRQLSEACHEVDCKEGAIKALIGQLPPESEDPVKRCEALQIEIDNIERDLESKRREMNQIEGRLEEIAQSDLYLERARAEERLDLTKRELHRELVRARALRLIQVLFERHKQAMSVGLSKPIEDKVSSYWGYVRDRSDVRASLSADIELALLDGSGASLEPDLFSAGAREQLYVIARLAVAELLSSREPQIVVLDDALVFTDSHRHDRMLEIVKQLSEKMQILILTSHEDRFRALPGARFDLAELRHQSLLA
jgi:DNA repair exonuclease SbcCD ATPase subunit